MSTTFFTPNKNVLFTAIATVTIASVGLTLGLSEGPASADVLIGAAVTAPIESTAPHVPRSPVVQVVTEVPPAREVTTVPVAPTSPEEPAGPVTPVTPVTPVVPPVTPVTPVPPGSETGIAPKPIVKAPQRTAVHRPTSMKRLSSGFGSRRAPCWGCSRFHSGLDITPGYGARVVTVANGVVVRSGNSRSLGVNLAIRHVVNGSVVVSVYAHLQRGSVRVGVGQRVRHGQQIARVGNTGASTGAHLHFEIRNASGRAINPSVWLKRNVNR
jgi:murein DD-endopeptidase MepM/ murein hydrolase activator NlpD